MKVVIMHKIVLSLFFIATISYGMEEEGLRLVVGSVRESDLKTTFPVENLWQEKKADFSLKNAYPGKETTSMDLRESSKSGVKHIIGNASTYQFGKNTIQAAYLERLPTMNQGLKAAGTESNYLGKCIQNIGSAMKQGAVIEVEWHPYINLFKVNANSIKSLYDEDKIKKDPFTTTLSIDLAILATEMACLPSLDCDSTKFFSQEFINYANKLSENIKQLICFYEKQNMGTKILLNKRLAQEVWLFRQFLMTGQQALLSYGPSASLEEFSKAIACFPFVQMQDSSMVGLPVAIKKEGQLFMGKLYDQSLFLSESLLNFILCDASIESNSPHVKEFMEKNNFKDVTVKRTKSLRNGRENVWIVTGTKA